MTRKFTRHTSDDVEPYVTKDGSLIRELMHPNTHGNKNQSLAEATIKAGATTESHRHRTSEEIYYIIEGTGIVIIYEEKIRVAVGSVILIPPDTPHCIWNTSQADMKIICCSSPPYSHDDTDLI